MKLITRLAAGTAIAGALFGLAGVPGAVAEPSTTDDVHVNYLAGPYTTRGECELVRAIVNITHPRNHPCFSTDAGLWYFYWYDNR